MQNRLDKDPWGPQSEGSWPWKSELHTSMVQNQGGRFGSPKTHGFFGEFQETSSIPNALHKGLMDYTNKYIYIYCILYVHIYIYIMYGYSPVKSCSVSHGNHRSCHRFTSPSNVRVLLGTGRLSLELHETIPIVDVPSGKQRHSY